MPGSVELDFEAEKEEEEAYVEYDITTYPSDFTLEGLSQMKSRGDIVIPDYQRKYVWDIRQASLLVESFLLGLPVPPLFLYVMDDNKYEVIDGQQRLMSVVYYLDGYFGVPDRKGKRQLFRLTGLSERSPFRFKPFADLEDRHQRKLKSSVLRAINVRQLNPSKTSTSVFHIFERLNTGGTTLKPQEIRNAVFRGRIVSVLRTLNSNPLWRTILGSKEEDTFQRDVELILRLFSLFRQWGEYEKPMKEYLNREMQKNGAFDSLNAIEFQENFPEVLRKVVTALGPRPFRPRKVINSAVLEAVLVTLLEHPHVQTEGLAARYDLLVSDPAFESVIRGATTDTKVVRERLSLAARILVS